VPSAEAVIGHVWGYDTSSPFSIRSPPPRFKPSPSFCSYCPEAHSFSLFSRFFGLSHHVDPSLLSLLSFSFDRWHDFANSGSFFTAVHAVHHRQIVPPSIEDFPIFPLTRS